MRRLIKKIIFETVEDIKPKSNLDKVLDKFKMKFPDEYKSKVDTIGEFVVDYIKKHNFTVKYLNSCSTGFAGVRTKNQIIICSPNDMTSLSDFLYTIFHEIRHEEQISHIKMPNPLTDYDLEDFESLSEQYWKMEMDADKFGKEMLAKLIIKLELPMDIIRQHFKLSPFIEKYPSMSNMIKHSLKQIVDGIKMIRRNGGEYEDIQDHPLVKRHIEHLENFI